MDTTSMIEKRFNQTMNSLHSDSLISDRLGNALDFTRICDMGPFVRDMFNARGCRESERKYKMEQAYSARYAD